jgi:demethylmenaquinone methyltransferase/2-methoxy-6-polyprenyl-1,4-benzoquinol methylase
MTEKGVDYGFRKVAPSDKRRLVDDHFARIARRYDLADAVLSLGIHKLWKRKAVRALGAGPGDRVLDLCGGTADIALLTAPIVGREGLVCVYDISRPMMEVGRRKTMAAADGGNIVFVEGDGEVMALRDNSVDGVIVGFGIRNLIHPEEGLRESFRVLKDGGVFVCLEFSMPTNPVFRFVYNIYSRTLLPFIGGLIAGADTPYRYLHESVRVFPPPERIVATLKEIGFSDVAYERLTNGIVVIYRAVKGRSTRTPGFPAR